MDLANNINRESQMVEKIAKRTAEECTDKTMKYVCHALKSRKSFNYAASSMVILLIIGCGRSGS